MNLKNNFNKIKYYFRRYGFLKTLIKVFKRLFHVKENRKTNKEEYDIWIKNNEPHFEELEKQKNTKFKFNPKISIVTPMYNTNEFFFEELINSLINQTYYNWELCLADGSENQNPRIIEIINNNANNDKIKYNYLNENKGISENTNEAIKMATGKYIGFLDHDDLLSKDCLYEIVKCINENPDVEFIYTDEDKIDETGERFEPYFKPDFSLHTLECNNYITHFVVVKRNLQEKIGYLNSNFNGAQDFDFVLRISEHAKVIKHIPKVLYHWRVHKSSTANVADSKPYAYEAGIKVIEEHLKRIGKKAKVEYGQDVPGIYKIKYDIIGNPKVSILIPNKDNVNLLKTCLNSITSLTTYDNYEIIVIENNSEKKETFEFYKKIINDKKIRILNFNNNIILDNTGERDVRFKREDNDNEFNYSKLINFGVKNSDGEFILQLNNDTKLISKDWLETFIGYVQNEEVGAVGARLYYEDKSIQHAGIIIGLSGFAGNGLVNLPYGNHCYFGRESATRDVSAVTGACLFSRRDIYEKVGFMDENNFKVAFNDVDFCLKIIEKGFSIIYNPYVELYHYESKSRGYEYSKEKEDRFNREKDAFITKWKDYIDKGDPYYSPNFSLESCNYDIKIN